MAINVANKYSTKLDERFHQKSVTDAFAGKDYDFVGVNAINVYTRATSATTPAAAPTASARSKSWATLCRPCA